MSDQIDAVLKWAYLPFLILFLFFGIRLEDRAKKYLREPSRIRLRSPLFDPQAFLPEGRRAVQLANRFWVVGLGCFIAYTVLLVLIDR